MSKVTLRIKQVRRPVSDELIGYRLQAAFPNSAARKMKPIKQKGQVVGFSATKQETTSFRGEYLITESSDMTAVGEKDYEKFRAILRDMGFTHFNLAGSEEAGVFEL